MGLRKEGYWDKHYELELRNYEEDGDEGEIWFGKGLSKKIVKWIHQHLPRESNSAISILDVGCGNGYLLYTLAEMLNQEDKINLFGLDYAINSVELCRKILVDKNMTERINIDQCDFLDHKQIKNMFGDRKFDFIVDKGTFDAICLLADDSSLLHTKTRFMESLYLLVDYKSIFILASCNHTEEELKELLTIDCQNRLNSEVIDTIETPKIKFGGVQGSQVSCIIVQFRRP